MAPVLLQNIVTTLVNLLDNIMVGQVGTEPMSGVAIANQLIFIFNLCIFGGLSGAGIYTAQFYGKNDNQGVTNTIRIKLVIGVASCVLFALIFWVYGGDLINTFLHQGNEALDLEATYRCSISYLHIMMLEMLPFAFSQVYASTLRETSETAFPMKASLVAVGVNLLGNYILIFGKFGAPALGAEGAAIATVIARLVECGILIIYSHAKKERFPFFQDVYRSLKVPAKLVKEVAKKGTPLLINEVLWSAGMTMQAQCYSVRGLEVVSATNITFTVFDLFFSAAMATGSTIAIIIGQRLGAGERDRAIREDKQILVLALALSVILGGILAVCVPLITGFYNTTSMVRSLASSFLYAIACMFPLFTYTNCCYFTLRTGGKTIITFIFDSFMIWVLYVPVAFILANFTNLDIVLVFIIVNGLELVKCLIGFFMMRSGKWAINLVADEKMS